MVRPRARARAPCFARPSSLASPQPPAVSGQPGLAERAAEDAGDVLLRMEMQQPRTEPWTEQVAVCDPRGNGGRAVVGSGAGFSGRPRCGHRGVSRCHRSRLVVCRHGTTGSLVARRRRRARCRGGVRHREPRRLSPWATARASRRSRPALRARAVADGGSPRGADAGTHRSGRAPTATDESRQPADEPRTPRGAAPLSASVRCRGRARSYEKGR